MPVRVLTAVVLLVCSIAISGAPSVAAPGGGGESGSAGSQAAGVLRAHVRYSSESGGGGGGDGCSWRRVDGALTIGSNGTATWPFERQGVVYHLWQRRCPGRDPTYYQIAESDPADMLPSLLERLRKRELPSPDPVFAHLDPIHGWAYVTVPLDFRAGGDSWRPVSVTASVGPVWATVMAEPVALTFDGGEPGGSPAACAGAAPVAGYDPAVPGQCSYTYTNSSSVASNGSRFETVMEIEWAISWTSSTGAGGALESYTTSASEALAVAEVQGLVTCTGPRSSQGGC